MGNLQSADVEGKQPPRMLATAAVAKYMSLSKHQVILLQEAMDRRTRSSRKHQLAGSAMIKRKHFQAAMDEVKIKKYPDQDILINLFTMWDTTGSGRIPAHEFIVGITPLACGGDAISTVLAFALQIHDLEGEGQVSPSEATVLLKSINATASYFGDAVLGLRQIYKVVDNAFDSMSVGSEDSEFFAHKDTIHKLTQHHYIQQLITKGTIDIDDHHHDFDECDGDDDGHETDDDIFSFTTEDTMSHASGVGGGSRFSCGVADDALKAGDRGGGGLFRNPRLEETSMTSEVSSVVLSPLAVIPVEPAAAAGRGPVRSGADVLRALAAEV